MINIMRTINKKKANKGITLIALVITIIILLILAGITIATLTGENGILTKASSAKKETTIAKEKEHIGLAYNSVKAEKIVNGENSLIEVNEIQKELNNQEAGAIASKSEDKIVITFTETGNIYFLDNSGKIEGPYKDGETDQESQSLEQLERRVATLENKTTMKSKTESVSNVKLEKATWKTIVSTTIEEDGYADLYGYFNMANNNSEDYKGINMYQNNFWIAGNGKGGSGRKYTRRY